jgi:signal-transduction protein with cAMP-binding, CBS, and nucleotidyltransferase domain
VRRIADERDLAGYARELAGVVEALFWAGVEAETIGRVVARLNDALLARLLSPTSAKKKEASISRRGACCRSSA